VGEKYRFGEFEFDAGSQELRRVDGGDVQRLAPQPAQLLQMLAERRGAVVTREEIRQRLWPDTHVDFDAGLHFCVRQVRAALGDSANDPRYVQNVPRRGYRLMQTETARVSRPPAGPALRWVVAALALAIATGGAVRYYDTMMRTATGAPRVRIGIMPFESRIAEQILQDLSAAGGGDVGLVGPTTTAAYAQGDAGVRRLAADYRLDYVINARPLASAGGRRVLAELIRVSDGVHVWVRPYADLSDGERIGQEISANVARVLKLGPVPAND
jgi:DNA-binding winged helix-turn-helix (wHTH) protein/TolB-like protein